MVSQRIRDTWNVGLRSAGGIFGTYSSVLTSLRVCHRLTVNLLSVDSAKIIMRRSFSIIIETFH